MVFKLCSTAPWGSGLEAMQQRRLLGALILGACMRWRRKTSELPLRDRGDSGDTGLCPRKEQGSPPIGGYSGGRWEEERTLCLRLESEPQAVVAGPQR